MCIQGYCERPPFRADLFVENGLWNGPELTSASRLRTSAMPASNCILIIDGASPKSISILRDCQHMLKTKSRRPPITCYRSPLLADKANYNSKTFSFYLQPIVASEALASSAMPVARSIPAIGLPSLPRLYVLMPVALKR